MTVPVAQASLRSALPLQSQAISVHGETSTLMRGNKIRLREYSNRMPSVVSQGLRPPPLHRMPASIDVYLFPSCDIAVVIDKV